MVMNNKTATNTVLSRDSKDNDSKSKKSGNNQTNFSIFYSNLVTKIYNHSDSKGEKK